MREQDRRVIVVTDRCADPERIRRIREQLGEVTQIIPTGSNIILAVNEGDEEILLPFIDDVVLEVDVEAGTMKVHLLEGLR